MLWMGANLISSDTDSKDVLLGFPEVLFSQNPLLLNNVLLLINHKLIDKINVYVIEDKYFISFMSSVVETAKYLIDYYRC
jgi:hypothetical protein